jgi:hypothetical protein
MADLQTALIDRLLSDTAVAGLVARRGYWGVVPQGTVKPYFRLLIISDPRTQHLKGYDGSRSTRVQADCYGATYAASVGLAKAIVAAMAQPATTSLGRFGRTHAEGPRDLGEDTTAGFVHRASVDLLVRHRLA